MELCGWDDTITETGKMNVETENETRDIIVRKSEALEFHFSILGKHMYVR